ncbi:Vegetative incompatibility protein HET-E-1 [Colletotrichum viniferum]|nr:Vegetative incompatibility protein HET-E-1 [Colletotrichum viniferum]
MWLIDVETLQTEEFFGKIPQYAILSHTWHGTDEVTFREWEQRDSATIQSKSGYTKILNACHQTQKEGLRYLWVDTNCINKESSAELSEAINSMFVWYRDAQVCFAFLDDVQFGPPFYYTSSDLSDERTGLEIDDETGFIYSRWFTRGWTLQELLGPTRLIFFDCNWKSLGTRSWLSRRISTATNIDEFYLADAFVGDPSSRSVVIEKPSISEKMSWLSTRKTTRVEDLAYCMLGIFDLNMPLLYGEGMKAFARLQEEIIKGSNDQTIFCWPWDKNIVPLNWGSLLAPEPSLFKDGRLYGSTSTVHWSPWSKTTSYVMTNAGLRIRFPTLRLGGGIELAILTAHHNKHFLQSRVCITLKTILPHGEATKSVVDDSATIAQRFPIPPDLVVLNELDALSISASTLKEICIRPLPNLNVDLDAALRGWELGISRSRVSASAILLIFDDAVGCDLFGAFPIGGTSQLRLEPLSRNLFPVAPSDTSSTSATEFYFIQASGAHLASLVVGIHRRSENTYFPGILDAPDWFCYFKEHERHFPSMYDRSTSAVTPDGRISVRLDWSVFKTDGFVIKPVYVLPGKMPFRY